MVLWTFLDIFWCPHIGISIQFQPRSENVGSSGIHIFSFSSFCHAVFQRGCTNSCSHWRYTRALVALHPHSELSIFTVLVILMAGVVVSHCSLNLHFHGDLWSQVPFPMFTWHLGTCFFKVPTQLFCHFSSVLAVFFLLTCRNSYILDMCPLSAICIENISSPCGLPDHSLNGVF